MPDPCRLWALGGLLIGFLMGLVARSVPRGKRGS